MIHEATKGIIIAAGVGERLKPVTDTVPKPLINVNGTVMIESIIDGLIENEIMDIYVVVGYLQEQFNYLAHKYNNVNITFVYNPFYASCNNISSLYAARELLGDDNCIITDGDFLIHNPGILNPHFDVSGYCSIRVDESTEWLQDVDADGYVKSCSRTGGKNGWQLFSLSFWTVSDGQSFKKHLTELFERRKVRNVYYDDIPMFYFKDEYQLKIREIKSEDLTEIDNLNELAAIDSRYRQYL